MVPVISFVGSANSGKTTCLEEIIPLLRQRGYRVGVVKHHGYDFAIDHPGKDTWRFAQAGAEAVALASPQKLAVVRLLPVELPLAEIVKGMGAIDLLLAEGYKQGKQDKIEVVRSGRKPVMPAETLLAMVADEVHYESVPTFPFGELHKLVDFLECRFCLEPRRAEAGQHA